MQNSHHRVGCNFQKDGNNSSFNYRHTAAQRLACFLSVSLSSSSRLFYLFSSRLSRIEQVSIPSLTSEQLSVRVGQHSFVYHVAVRATSRFTLQNSYSQLGTKVNNMASRVKGLVCLGHHEHGRTYRSHDFSGGGRSRVLVS